MAATKAPTRLLPFKYVDLGSTASGTVTVDLSGSLMTVIYGTQTGSLTITFTNASAGAQVSADVLQGGAGGHSLAFTLTGGTVAYPENQAFSAKTTAGAYNTFAGMCFSATRINANSSRY